MDWVDLLADILLNEINKETEILPRISTYKRTQSELGKGNAIQYH